MINYRMGAETLHPPTPSSMGKVRLYRSFSGLSEQPKFTMHLPQTGGTVKLPTRTIIS